MNKLLMRKNYHLFSDYAILLWHRELDSKALLNDEQFKQVFGMTKKEMLDLPIKLAANMPFAFQEND